MQDYDAFSQSTVWDLQKQYYQQIDIAQSWGKNDIPFFATSNPFIADNYCHLIQSYIHCNKNKLGENPLFIVETGVGHGRFSFLLLKRLQELRTSNNSLPLIKYIMTDVSENNIKAWKKHPGLQVFIQQGILDFALFDVVSLNDPILENAKIPLCTQLNNKPFLVISNFMLCALPYDLFRVHNGQIQHCQVQQVTKPEHLQYHDAKSQLKNLSFKFSYQPIASDFYSNPLLNQVLQEYPQQISQGTFTFPIYIIELFNYFYQINSNFSWLITDEALIEKSQLENSQAIIGKIKNGTFSNRINLHALSLYLKNFPQNIRYPSHPDKRTDTYLIMSKPESSSPEHDSQDQHLIILDDFRAKSYFQLLNSLQKAPNLLEVDGLLALFELSHYDPILVQNFYSKIMQYALTLSGYRKRQLRRSLFRCWENYYDIGETFNMAFSIGRLLRRLDSPKLAIPLLQDALERSQDDYKCWYILGKSFQSIGDVEPALNCYNKVLRLNPAHDHAKKRIKALS